MTSLRWTLCTLLLVAACGGDDGPPDASMLPDAPPPMGTVKVAWTISDGANTVGCDDVGARDVLVTWVPAEGGAGGLDSFACESATGTTSVPPGTYNFTVKLSSPVGDLGDPVTVADVTVTQNQESDLGTASFVTTTTGNLLFRIAPPQGAVNNCGDEASSGAGIDAHQIVLRDSGGTCVPATFQVGASGTYTLDCGNIQPYPGGCIESDVQITLSDFAAGQYRIDVTGLEGAEACYTGSAQVGIVGGGKTRDVGNILVALDDQNANCETP